MTTPVVSSFSHGLHPGGGGGGQPTHTVNLPTGIASGDLLVAFLDNGGGAVTTTWTGWTQLGSGNYGVVDGTASCWYRIADGSEGSTSTYSVSPSGRASYHIYRITSYTGVPVLAAWADMANDSAGDPPNLTSGFGAVETLWLAAIAFGNTVTVSGYPSSYTDGSYDVDGSVGAGVGSARRFTTAASENPGAFTLSGNSWNISATVAVNGSGTPLVGVQGSMAVGLIG